MTDIEKKQFINVLEHELHAQEIQISEEDWMTIFLSIKRALEEVRGE
jgi:hypothetical protein